MALNKSKEIPTSRLARLGKFGGLFGNIAMQMLLDGAKQVANGKRPSLDELLLQPKNMLQLADKLAHLRGAAMKLGQIMSMDIGDVLPEELAEILAVLRDSANPMPQQQVEQMLQENWGDDWQQRLASFDMQPFAAASIGQVHKATSLDGRELAIKVQYPGIGKAIHSDVDNLGALLKLTNLVPPQMNLPGLLLEVKMQLIREADYELEAGFLRRYADHVQHMPSIMIPEVEDELSNQHILAMEYIDAMPLQQTLTLPQSTRDHIATTLVELLIAEVFEFRLIQSDPNLANYLYHQPQNKLVLLDFGATRKIPDEISDAYLSLLSHVLQDDLHSALAIATELGFFTRDIPVRVKEIYFDVLAIAAEPLKFEGAYDFGASDLARRIQQVSMELMQYRDAIADPPVDALFIHRKVGGLYMLLSKIRAKVDLNFYVTELLAEQGF